MMKRKMPVAIVQHSKRTRSSVFLVFAQRRNGKIKYTNVYKICSQIYLVTHDKNFRNAQVIARLKGVEADSRKKFLLIIQNGS